MILLCVRKTEYPAGFVLPLPPLCFMQIFETQGRLFFVSGQTVNTITFDGIIGPWFLKPWQSLVREHYEVHYIILRASKEETLKRAVERSKLDRKTNIELVETMWEQFCNLGIYESNVIDTTTYSIQETVSAVQEKIASRAALLS